jgi:glycerol-3-phosphate dehydrogenase (NAD(P)+)
MIGVQWCGALKNVLTIALGVARGVGMPQNGIAALCAFGLQEIRLLVESRGGSAATVYGICGVGDLLLTAFGTQSRNMRFGKALGEGCSLAQAYERAGGIVEGANTAQSLFKQFHLDTKSYTKHPLKLLAAVAAVVMEEAAPSAIVQSYWAL